MKRAKRDTRFCTWRAPIGVGTLGLVFGFFWACSDSHWFVVAPEDTPFIEGPVAGSPVYDDMSGSGVAPIVFTGNPSCGDLNADDMNFPTISSDFGFKIHESTNGTYTFERGNGELTGNAPQDAANSITVSKSDGAYFDWAATLGIDAVIVKGGPQGNAYVYTPEAFGDTGLHSPTNPGTGKPYEISHIEFCYDYELTAKKTAAAEYTRAYTWQITKGVDPISHRGFLGSTFSSDYEVSVDQTVTDSDWKVTGEITITNPAPFTVDFSVSDLVDGTEATVDCGTHTLEAGASLTCPYKADLDGPADGTNIATISSSNPHVSGTTATADYTFGDPTTVEGSPTIHVTDYFDFDPVGVNLGTASGDFTFEYKRDFECPTDQTQYTDGLFTDAFPNTSQIDETEQTAEAIVDVACYALVVEKDATTSWTREYGWAMEKSADPASHSGTPGGSYISDYTVSVDQTITEGDFLVSGTIKVTNPSVEPVTVGISDVVGGTTAALDCGGTLSVGPGATETCGYSAELPSKTDGTNTAILSLGENSFTASADYAFSPEPTAEIGFASINVTDTNGEIWTAIADAEWTYQRTFTCSSEAGDYSNGAYTEQHSNTASINEIEGLTASADVDLTCTPFSLMAEKTSEASYDELHDWGLEKTVTPTSQSGFAGDGVAWTWAIDITGTVVEENFAVSGEITVQNANPFPVDFSVSDVLDDDTPVTVTCGDGPTGTVPGSVDNEIGTVICTYAASPTDASATLNTATVESLTPGIGDAPLATAPVTFVKNVINGNARVSDEQMGLLGQSVSHGDQITLMGSHTCSSDWADYGADGTYSGTLENTAILTDEEGNEYTSSASTTYTCEAASLDVLKRSGGSVDPGKDWQFSLFLGPDGTGDRVGTTSSTLDDSDGILDFGDPVPVLRPDETYTICELGLPAGWSTEWSIDGATVAPYNPNSHVDLPEDLGHRCLDVGVGTDYPLAVGQHLRITVDNFFPGGAPRTPGYWKNWSSCAGGGQYARTTDDVDPWNEFISLDEVLNSSGISWDDIEEDDLVFPITQCEDAVNLLDQRDLVRGKKSASDAAFTLSMHLLAYQLNDGAGACEPPGPVWGDKTIQDIALEAETLLDQYNFNGLVAGNGENAGYLTDNRNPDKALALELADYLDRYNNGAFCGGGGG